MASGVAGVDVVLSKRAEAALPESDHSRQPVMPVRLRGSGKLNNRHFNRCSVFFVSV